MIRLVDCRAREQYLAGHVPGAVTLDPESDLTGDVGGGRHPLPDAGAFSDAASRAGIGAGTFVLAYDEGTGWCTDLAVEVAPDEPFAWDARVIADAAFGRYARAATDYAGGRKIS